MFIAIDGNSTGKIIERFIFEQKLDALTNFSQELQRQIQNISERIAACSGTIIMAGGDNVLAEIPELVYPIILQYVKAIAIDNYHFSIAISESAQGAYMGLKYAKATNAEVVRVDVDKNGNMVFVV